MPAVNRRRTQAERKAETMRRLVDAGMDALVEVGYARASVQEICGRAGLSSGALFRHFPTREVLLVAVAEDSAVKVMEEYRRRFSEEAPPEETTEGRLRRSLLLLRDACRSRPNQAWYELATAARTNDALLSAMEPMAIEYYGAIARLAREVLPELAERLGGGFDPLVEVVVAAFDGEQTRRFLTDSPGADGARLEVLTQLVLGAS
jgi:AcrR family transcriptional regulator